jgi:ribonuclease HI
MEMTAMLMGIQSALEFETKETIEIVTDSAYIHNCRTQYWYKNWQANGWKNAAHQPVANQDLWELLIQYFDDPKFIFKKTKGHADDKFNNMVDELAKQGAKDAK